LTELEQIELRAGKYYLKLPYTIEGIKIARSLLDFLEKQLAKQVAGKEEAKSRG